MEFTLKARDGMPVAHQLALQMEMKILCGQWPLGHKLPSIRALARLLQVRPATVASAYRWLQVRGDVETRHGAGVFVHRGAPRTQERRDPRGMLQSVLDAALRQGLSPARLRGAIDEWLGTPPPNRVAVVDPARETADVLAEEIREALGAHPAGPTIEAHALAAVEAHPDDIDGALVASVPFHVDRLARLYPQGAPILSLYLEPPEPRWIRDLPEGGMLLVVSHSPRVLPFVSAIVRSLRGTHVLLEAHLLRSNAWRRLTAAADVVLVDRLALPRVRETKPKRLRTLRLLSRSTIEDVRRALAMPAVSPPRLLLAERSAARPLAAPVRR